MYATRISTPHTTIDRLVLSSFDPLAKLTRQKDAVKPCDLSVGQMCDDGTVGFIQLTYCY